MKIKRFIDYVLIPYTHNVRVVIISAFRINICDNLGATYLIFLRRKKGREETDERRLPGSVPNLTFYVTVIYQIMDSLKVIIFDRAIIYNDQFFTV